MLKGMKCKWFLWESRLWLTFDLCNFLNHISACRYWCLRCQFIDFVSNLCQVGSQLFLLISFRECRKQTVLDCLELVTHHSKKIALKCIFFNYFDFKIAQKVILHKILTGNQVLSNVTTSSSSLYCRKRHSCPVMSLMIRYPKGMVYTKL